MDKRTLLAIALCMGILVLWWKVFPPTPPAPPAPKPTPAATTPAPAPASPDGQAAGTTAGATTTTPGDAPAVSAPAPEERVVLDTEKVRFVLSSHGGVLREARLKEPKFLADRKDPKSGYDLVQTTSRETLPLRTTFPGSDIDIPDNVGWTVSRPGPDRVTFRAETDRVAVEKRYRLLGDFRLALEVVVENKTGKPLNESLALHVFGKQDPEKKGGGFWDMAAADMAAMVCFVDGSVERDQIESLAKEPKEKTGAVNWVAADSKYFVIAAVPAPENPAQPRKCVRRASDSVTGEALVSLASRTIPASGQISHEFVVFAGPKYISELRQVSPGGQDVQLDKVVDVTFAVLSRPLLFLLKVFHGWIGNWGLAIIMLTFFVKLITFYPTQKAMMSGKKMQRLAPKMQELRKKYEGDRQRLGVETMNLYKTHGVSPLGGCLPTLITMPIWIALFSTLNYAVELHRTPFLGYIHDLSARDPYFITPLLMGAIMFLQMRMSPAGADPQQQKMMSIMMPVMFTGFSMFLPAGLAIYTLTNSLLAILQQLLVNHMDRKAHGPVRA